MTDQPKQTEPRDRVKDTAEESLKVTGGLAGPPKPVPPPPAHP